MQNLDRRNTSSVLQVLWFPNVVWVMPDSPFIYLQSGADICLEKLVGTLSLHLKLPMGLWAMTGTQEKKSWAGRPLAKLKAQKHQLFPLWGETLIKKQLTGVTEMLQNHKTSVFFNIFSISSLLAVHVSALFHAERHHGSCGWHLFFCLVFLTFFLWRIKQISNEVVHLLSGCFDQQTFMCILHLKSFTVHVLHQWEWASPTAQSAASLQCQILFQSMLNMQIFSACTFCLKTWAWL